MAVACFPLLALPYLHQLLQGRRRGFSYTELPETIARFDDYLLPWSTLFIYGVLFLYAVSGLSIVLIWLVGEIAGLYFTRAIAVLDFLFLAIASFLVGSWVGSRARRHPFRTSAAIISVYSFLAALTLSLFRSSFRLIPFAIMSGVVFLVSLLGTWAGARRCVASYLRYLLSFVDHRERVHVADRVFQEVVSMVSPGTTQIPSDAAEQLEGDEPELKYLLP